MVFSNDSFIYKVVLKAKRESAREIWTSLCPYHRSWNKKYFKKYKTKAKAKPWSKT